MALKLDLQNKYKTKSYSKKNNAVFGDYLKTNLQKDELQKVMTMIHHPEIHQPLIKNIDALLGQSNFTPDMRAQLIDQIHQLPDSKLNAQALTKLNTNSPKSSLLSDLNINIPDKKLSLKEQLQNKIRLSYNIINENINVAKQKMIVPLVNTRDKVSQSITTNKSKIIDKIQSVKQSVGNRKNKITDTITPAIDIIMDNAKSRLDDLREEYHVRKLTRVNDRNLTTALQSGISADQISDGIKSLDYPEIRYGMIHNADELLKQKSMTLDLALDLYSAAEPYLNDMPNNNLKKSFIQAFDTYSKNHATELSEALDGNLDNLNTQTKTDKTTETEKPVETAKPVETDKTTETEKPVETEYKDFKQAHLSEYTATGESKWDIETPQGTKSMSDTELTNALQEQYPDELPFEFSNNEDAKMAEQVTAQAFENGLDTLEEPPVQDTDMNFFDGLDNLSNRQNSELSH